MSFRLFYTVKVAFENRESDRDQDFFNQERDIVMSSWYYDHGRKSHVQASKTQSNRNSKSTALSSFSPIDFRCCYHLVIFLDIFLNGLME
jgi:hypothetical protein